MTSSKMILKWNPEGGSKREWTVDLARPAWDVAFQTEVATGWPWDVFVDKLALNSAVALRALLFTLRKRDEARLAIESVEVDFGELEFDAVPNDKPKKPKKSGEPRTDGASEGDDAGEA